MTRVRERNRSLLALAVFAVISVLAYSNTLDNPLDFDDRQNIVENTSIRLTELSPKALLRAGQADLAGRRPVSTISFGLNYYFHKYEPSGYHAVNIAIHILTGIFFYFFLGNTFALPYFRRQPANYRLIAFFAALLWLAHPIQTQSVTYVVQRMNSLAAMFYVLSCLCYVKARSSGQVRKLAWFGGCGAAGLLALGSKEIAITLPFMLLLYEWFFFQDRSKEWLKKRLPVAACLLIIVVLTAFFYLGANPLERVLAGYARRDFTIWERVLTQFRVVIHYVGLLFFPHPSRLNLDYDFALSQSLFSPPGTFFSLLGIVAVVLSAIFLSGSQRFLSFCVFWFFGNLVLESSIIPLEIIFEHRLYLPSMFFIAALVYIVFRCVGKEKVMVAGFTLIALVLGVWTYERNAVWGDSVLFWQDCVSKSANKPRPHNYLGLAYLERNRLAEARLSFKTAIGLDPGYAQSFANLGVVAEKEGKIEEALANYLEALRLDPTLATVHNSIGFLLAGQGKIDKAISRFREAIHYKPDYARAHNNLGILLQRRGKLAEAVEHFREASRLDADYRQARDNLNVALQLLNSKDGKNNNN